MDVLRLFFSWPGGGVWSNVIAEVVIVPGGFVVHHVLMRRHHDRKLADQTAELKDHMTTTLGGTQQ